MLICPQCKFENPDINKFCESCGTSLTEKNCLSCGTDVPVNMESCHNCGTFCGTVWWVIIAKDANCVPSNPEDLEVSAEVLPIKSTVQQEDGESTKATETFFHNSQIKEFTAATSEISSKITIEIGSYLDSQQRYKILEIVPKSEEFANHNETYVRVLDCQPYQVTPLMAIYENKHQGLTISFADLEEIPNLAKPYLVLLSQQRQGIPLLHDAWRQGDVEVLILEDYSNLQYLLELWHEEATSSLQILHCLSEMTQLWVMLEPLQCRQSLLELSNLRLDEDQVLVLQRLYPETASLVTSENQGYTVQSLAQIWHTLFKQSQRTQFGPLLQLMGDLDLGEIETLEQLQLRLQAIASELQPSNSYDLIPNDGDVTVTLVNTQIPVAPTVLQFGELEENDSKSDDFPTVVLPMQLASLENAGLTDVGRQRDHNEDYFGIETRINQVELPRDKAIAARGTYVLCDGMGGHAGGEVASELAVSTLRKYFQTNWTQNSLPNEEIIREGVRQANQAIFNINQEDARSGVGRMGTTLVMLLAQNTHIAVAHVGDSRLYRLTRKRGLEQMTIDHEVGQREIARGVDASIAYSRPDAYQLTQALGPRENNMVEPDVQFLKINEDTLFILASDGLSDNNLLETHWRSHLEPLLSSNANLERGVSELIDLANKYNGHDNITAVLIRAKVRANGDKSEIKGRAS
jgi:protein phosphatase